MNELGWELGELAAAEAWDRIAKGHQCAWCKGWGGLLDGKPAHPNFQGETCPACGGTGGMLPKPGTPPAPATIPAPAWCEEEPTLTDVRGAA